MGRWPCWSPLSGTVGGEGVCGSEEGSRVILREGWLSLNQWEDLGSRQDGIVVQEVEVQD